MKLNNISIITTLLLASCSTPAPSHVPLESSAPHDAAAALADASPDAATTLSDAGNDAAAALADADSSAGSASAPHDAAAPDIDADISSTLLPDATAQLSETTSIVADASTDTDAAALDAGSDTETCPIPAALGSECDLVTSCGCAEGLVCRTANHHTGQTLCFDAGITPPYAACEFDQECGEGNVCEGGLCRPLCNTPDALCNDDSWCGKLSDTGRTVCLGNCNPLPFDLNGWSQSEDWLEIQSLQIERGLNTLPLRTLDYVGCGTGAYCRPGLKGTSPFPYCIPSTGEGELGATCNVNQDCITGLGCGSSECRIIAYIDTSCASGDVSRDGLDPDEWGAPDGYNNLALCLPE